MLQIKTIHRRLDHSEEFDAEVNAALAEGWTLTKRAHIFPHYALYAELEREVITEVERCCENCAYYNSSVASEPCISCNDDCSNWGAAR